ncbi:acetyl/propionyl/methylcrotonyl-CoA carboxylase subunit alpha [Neptunicoccus sediminis]|uniref:acetyl/propionyl/methylcrotonyl-CoA carboxylase subunit alpha n=1 Tax=Neptunicoccus sediminis TaxID=1892596 RepID=UPI000845EFE7|nr:acetyl/propionyl/methylcrotonyl-CoA carboxylase subunit alpha [Neptunicoccus sediminis]
MFNKILIANRGEIACRVMETCRKMGLATVAVYSDADATARHVAMADEAVRLGPAPVAESYLRGDAIIQAALDTGAQAVHPGYGFLSENPDFAQKLADAGLVFIGPSADAIRAMGLKDAAKALMEEAGVPVVPGYHGDIQEDAFLAKQAEAIGYPVLIKAVAGGGGKGMRLVDEAKNFAAELSSARSEAATAFGNSDVLVEKFVQNPRHIEIQVFGDSHGNAVHLFERDCSLQRRHQKVIEEAPAPDMPDAVREAMGAAAVRAAKAIGYSGAGTIEFIVDGSGPLREDGFWFMEMNTRLQVEHPVTEAITGQDLVEWQLRVASGEPLPKSQEDLSINGWAFEARIYAEDAARGFLPSIGTLSHLAFPAGARADTGVRAGDAITPHYDPMIAKLVVHGATRAQALGKLEQALARTEVAGCVTNLAFLGALTRHEDFAAGRVDTGLIARDQESLVAEDEPTPQMWALAAVKAAGLDLAMPQKGFTLWEPLARTVPLDHKAGAQDVVLRALGEGKVHCTVNAESFEVATRDVWRIDGVKPDYRAVAHGGGISLFGAQTHHFALRNLLDRGASDEQGAGTILAPMPGTVKEVMVSAGDTVSKGDTLAILEAMKMEHRMTAPFDGVIAEVPVSAGGQVTDGALLIRMEDPEEADAA